jgi:uncharacterized membrane protein YqaE (UPF0057 family)
VLLVTSSGSSPVVGFILLAVLYFIPTIVAASRKTPNSGSIFVVNLLLGWTMIGWIAALVKAITTKTYAAQVASGELGQPCAKCRTPMIHGHPFCSKCGAPNTTAT